MKHIEDTGNIWVCNDCDFRFGDQILLILKALHLIYLT